MLQKSKGGVMSKNSKKSSREMDVERFVIDQATKNTKDYKRLRASMVRSGMIDAEEHVLAIEFRPGCGDLSVIVGRA